MIRFLICSIAIGKIKLLYLIRICIFSLLVSSIYFPYSYCQKLSAEQIYKKVSGAVVVIYAYDYNDKLASQGSGVVINDKGYVVTNYHVLSGNRRLEILHGKVNIPLVDIIGIDVEKDILILKINAKKFPSIKIGNSDYLNIGEDIFAIGSPLGFENTISDGIISGLRTYNGKINRDLIQMTASISPGSSGGAVVNNKGQLIGISTLTAKDGQNLNFAIPINDVLKVKIRSYKKNNDYLDFDLYKRGNDLAISGDYNEAIKYYTRFLETHPSDQYAYYKRAEAKYKLGQFKNAIKDYNQAAAIDPFFEAAYNGRGIAKDEIGDYSEAIQDFNRAIELKWNSNEAYNNRGLAKMNLGDYKSAIYDFNKSIKLNPDNAEAFSNRGLVKDKLEDYIGAIQDYNISINLDPNSPDGYYNRGNAKFRLNDYRGAIQDYDKAIELNSNYADYYLNRGMAKYNIGNKSGACLDWSKAGELGSAQAYNLIRESCN